MVEFARAVIVNDYHQPIAADGLDLKLSTDAGKKHFADCGHLLDSRSLMKSLFIWTAIQPPLRCAAASWYQRHGMDHDVSPAQRSAAVWPCRRRRARTTND
jgi:hypothetical protein